MSVRLKWIAFVLSVGLFAYLGVNHVIHDKCQIEQKNILDGCTGCIIESSSITDVLKYVHGNGMLVAFDLDNTLVYPGKDLGSDQWFGYMFNQRLEKGMSRQDALAEVLPIYYKVHDHITLKLVEPDSLTMLNTLVHKGIITLVLTTRSLPMIERTKIQLKELGLSFASSKLFDKELDVMIEKKAVLSKGVIFCNDNNKGKTLIAMLQACNCNPETVIFVDDKLHHLLDVQKECLTHNIRFIGIRYGKLDAMVAQFDKSRAEQQYQDLMANIV